jgi:hypothetical protein
MQNYSAVFFYQIECHNSQMTKVEEKIPLPLYHIPMHKEQLPKQNIQVPTHEKSMYSTTDMSMLFYKENFWYIIHRYTYILTRILITT